MTARPEEPRPIYLDWNATTPPHPEVLAAMQRAAEDSWGNPSSVHSVGRKARRVVEAAREAIAELAGVEARDVFLTSGATEANNLALRHAAALVTSRVEHPSVVRVAEVLAGQGRTVRWVPVPPSGRIDPAEVGRASEGLAGGFVVALQAANHETGVIQPIADVRSIVAARGGRLHVDAAQAAGKLPPGQWALGDTLSIAAHKLRGPKGIGALVVRSGVPPAPVLVGGAQERGARPGTIDPVNAAGFGAAVRRAIRGGPERHAALAPLRDALEAGLTPFGTRNGEDAPRLPHVANLSLLGWRGDEAVAAFDLAGVCASSGSACSAGSHEPSGVVAAMVGMERAAAAVRFSLGDETTREDIEVALAAIIRVLERRGFSASSAG